VHYYSYECESISKSIWFIIKEGLAFILEIRGYLLSQEIDSNMLLRQRNNDKKFQDVQGNLKGQTIVDKLYDYFQIDIELQNVLYNISAPTYDQYTRLEITSADMAEFNYPTGREWKYLSIFARKGPPPS
jgi:hypothetical protein